MATRASGQQEPRIIGGRSFGSTDALSRWRIRLGSVAATLVGMFQARPIPVPVKVAATRERRSPRR
jgi:hypothetical protein